LPAAERNLESDSNKLSIRRKSSTSALRNVNPALPMTSEFSGASLAGTHNPVLYAVHHGSPWQGGWGAAAPESLVARSGVA
jgi:hypothetical protein